MEQLPEQSDDRLNQAELHSATDKVSFGIEFRSRGDSLHYKDIQMAPASFTSLFFAPVPNGFNGATQAQIQQALAANNYLAAIGSTKGALVSTKLAANTDLHTVAEFEQLVVRRERRLAVLGGHAGGRAVQRPRRRLQHHRRRAGLLR